MAALSSYFRDFLAEVRPTKNQSKEMQTGHQTLRDRLNKEDDLKDILVSDFLQGSYRRSTAIRPVGGKRSDVDIVVVTNLDSKTTTPREAMERFRPFLDGYYAGKWKFKGRSMGIELSYVDLDLVVTAAPSEVAQQALRSEAIRSRYSPEDLDDATMRRLWVSVGQPTRLDSFRLFERAADEPVWKTEPLLIPDRDADEWIETDPLAQIGWTFAKNTATERHFVNLVKSLKWWRRVKHETPKRPQGYPLEHIIGDSCPDGVESVAEGVVRTLEQIRDQFDDEARRKVTPTLWDRGVEQDVLKRLSGDDFAEFHEQCSTAADLARQAFDEADVKESARLWRQLLGDKFPAHPDDDEKGGEGSGGGPAVHGGYSRREEPTIPRRERFA